MPEINAMSVEIAKLNVRPGDVLVLRCNEIISSEMALRLRERFEGHLPEGIKMIVIDKTLSLAVLTREEIESRAA